MDHGIPRRLDDFTAELVNEALERSGTGGGVDEVNVEPIGAGDGFLGELARLHLGYDRRGGGPASLVAKIPTSDEGLKPLGMLLGVYEREARFYDELAEHLQIRIPGCIYNEWDDETESYALILEDLGHLIAGDQAAGASLEQARAALRAAAGVHGRWWKNETITDSEWVPRIDNPVNLGLQDLFAANFPTMVEMYGDVLGPELMKAMEDFIPTTGEFLSSYGDISVTLVHNDYRLDNMFFGDEVALVDWQIIGCGDGSGDFVPFLAVNLDTELRRAHETDLLQTYLDEMHAQEAGYADLEDLSRAYRGGLLFWLVAWCNSAVSGARPNERAVMLWDKVVERAAAAARDHDVRELIGDYSFHPEL